MTMAAFSSIGRIPALREEVEEAEAEEAVALKYWLRSCIWNCNREFEAVEH